MLQEINMYEFDNSLLVRRQEEKQLSLRALARLTKQVDPEGKGLSPMTVQRMNVGGEVNISSLLLVCEALNISPRSMFKRRV
jgi:hypothetical protein